MLRMRERAPDLSFLLTDGAEWSLQSAQPATFSLIVFYRGLHCPKCRHYLQTMQARLPEFVRLGVEVVAASVEPLDRALQAKRDWALHELPIGYGVSIDTGRRWGLFVSRAMRSSEPPEFLEPGLFLVRRDKTLFYAGVNSAAWGRPPVDEMVSAIATNIESQAPARGEA